MAEPDDTTRATAAAVRAALEAADLDAVRRLLADDVRWGGDDLPDRCRGPEQVLAMFAAGLAGGGSATVSEVTPGDGAVLCALDVHWRTPRGTRRDGRLYQVYRLRAGLVTEILAFDDRQSAAVATGIA